MPKTANIPANQTLSAHNPAYYSRKASTSTDFCPNVGMQGPSIAEYSQKCTSPPPPTWREPKQKRGLKGRAPSLIQIYIARNGSAEVTQARGQPSFPAHSAGRKKPSPHEVRSEGFLHVRGRAGRELTLCPDRKG